MASYRFSYLDDFVLKDGKIGIGTALPIENLDVVGLTEGEGSNVTGVATFSAYEGYLSSNQTIEGAVELTSGQGVTGSLSGEVIVGTGSTVTVSAGSTSSQGHLDSLKVSNTFTVPLGGINDRPSSPKSGTLYYNKDLKTIEFFDGNGWRQVDNTTTSGRGVFAGGYFYNPWPKTKRMSYIQIPTLGNAEEFGDLTIETRVGRGSFSSSTRGIFHRSLNASAGYDDTIEYITIPSKGNSIDFGDLTVGRNRTTAISSSTRGIVVAGFDGGSPGLRDEMDYVEISTIGDAIDFGNLTQTKAGVGGASSSTRGIFLAGHTPGNLREIDYCTIASKGNAIDFGGLALWAGTYTSGGMSDGVRALFAGGYKPNWYYNKAIQYVQIASHGNSMYFGDLTSGRTQATACSTHIRGVILPGDSGQDSSPWAATAYKNVLEYITISTQGNAADFGDDIENLSRRGALSDSHGGLGGF